MKTNIFKLSFMAFAAIALITGCSQNNEMLPDEGQNIVLKVSTSVQHFTPDATSRVIDEPVTGGYETKFETGDKIGVYVIAEDGTMMCKNMPMTYNATQEWESSSPLYFYKNATYIAYSPYNANLSGGTVLKEDHIKDYFINTVIQDPSKSYSECDLMTASATTGNDLPAANTSALTFNFAHAMSMVEFVIPVSNYKTPEGYEYSGPIFGLQLKKKEGAATAEKIENINALGKGVYRTLLVPVDANVTDKDMLFSGELFVGDGTQPVYFTTQEAFRPTSGTYKKVNVTYAGAPDPTVVVTRSIEVGDYYYSDGGIVPKDAAVIPSKNCIGVIFKVTSTTDPINIGGKTQACVLGLKNIKTKWGRKGSLQTQSGAKADFAEAYQVANGYIERDTNCGDITGTLNSYKENYSAPEISTNWYIPTLREVITAINNLQGNEVIIVNGTEDNWSLMPNPTVDNMIDALNLNNEENYTVNEWWWTINEVNVDNVWGVHVRASIEINSSRPKDQNQQNTSNPYMLRPVLAF